MIKRKQSLSLVEECIYEGDGEARVKGSEGGSGS